MGDKTTALIYIKEVFYTFKQLFPKLFQCNRHMPNYMYKISIDFAFFINHKTFYSYIAPLDLQK